MSSRWLTILEKSLGAALDVHSVERISLAQFRSLLPELLSFHQSAMLPSRTPSQLRPRLDGDGSWRAAGGLKTAAPKPLRAMVKSLLLLADSIALQDPLIEAWLIGNDDTQRLALLRRRLRDVARIADLIRTDIVVVYSPPSSLISMNSGYSITQPGSLGAVPHLTERDLTSEQLQTLQNQGLQFDWDAAWVAHALERGPEAPFADSLAVVETSKVPAQRLFFCGNASWPSK